jgi:hypothetical protein
MEYMEYMEYEGREMRMKSYLKKSHRGAFFKNRENALAMTTGKKNLNDAPLPPEAKRVDIVSII